MNEKEKLEKILEEIDELIQMNVTVSSPEFKVWRTKAARFLQKYYGNDSFEYKSFQKMRFSLSAYTTSTPKSSFIDACKKDLLVSKGIFQEYLEDIIVNNVTEIKMASIDKSKIFIVHGHDGELKQSVARLIEKQDLDVVILHEKPNYGAKTIIEKFENNESDVGAAVILLTADDEGKAKEEKSINKRARQNVIFEMGYCMGHLGRDNVILLAENDVELPSDIHGIVYTNKDNWQLDVLRELKVIGF